jgi:hypothetical protein
MKSSEDVFDWRGDNVFQFSGGFTAFIPKDFSAVMVKVVSGTDPDELIPSEARPLATVLLILAERLERQAREAKSPPEWFKVGGALPQPPPADKEPTQKQADVFDFREGDDEVYAFIDDDYSAVMVKAVCGTDPVALLPEKARRLATALLILAQRLEDHDAGRST